MSIYCRECGVSDGHWAGCPNDDPPATVTRCWFGFIGDDGLRPCLVAGCEVRSADPFRDACEQRAAKL